MPSNSRSINWWRVVFYTAAVTAVAMACLPSPPEMPHQLNDKALHFIAFGVLTTLAKLAYPKARSSLVLAGLAVLGLGIELLQSIPTINRNPERLDLIVDVFAIGFVLALFELGRMLIGLHQRSRAK